jgi:hypothetical protein
MTLDNPVRGVTVTLNGLTVSFQCEGDPIPDAEWDGPKGRDEDGRPKSKVSLPDNFQDTGFADEVASALEDAVT